VTVHTILRMGDARLLRQAQPVEELNTPVLDTLIADMFETMHAAQGAGLAAPQIGVNLQIVIFGFSSNARYPEAAAVPPTVLINPVIKPLSEHIEESWEGCLSVPGMRGMVPRWYRIHYQGVDQFGNVIDREVEAFHARVVQHECDHLSGILYPMCIRDLSKFGFSDVLFPNSALEIDD
jgi:peptide deformylase